MKDYVEIRVRFDEIPVGIYPEDFDKLRAVDPSRTTEYSAEKLYNLHRKFRKRVQRYGLIVFTEREIEAMSYELKVLRRVPRVLKVQQTIAAHMGITKQRVSKLLLSADALMLLFEISNSGYVGWINTGSREHSNWVLQAPRESEVARVLDMQTYFEERQVA